MTAAVVGGGTFTLQATASPGVTPSAVVSHSACSSTAHVHVNATTLNEDLLGSIGVRVRGISGSNITIGADRQLTESLSGYYTISDIV